MLLQYYTEARVQLARVSEQQVPPSAVPAKVISPVGPPGARKYLTKTHHLINRRSYNV